MNTHGLHWLGWVVLGCWLTACIGTPPLDEPTVTATLPSITAQLTHLGITVSVPSATASDVPSSTVTLPTFTSTKLLILASISPRLPSPTPKRPSLPAPPPTPMELTLRAPVFITYTVSPAQVRQDETFTLTWVTTNAEAVELTFLDYKGRMTQAIPLPPTGSLKVDRSKITAVEGAYYSFDFTAIQGQKRVSQSGRVDIVCEATWFFSPPPSSCPRKAQSTPIAAQRFEHGVLLWAKALWSGQPTIIVLYDTGYPLSEMDQDEWSAGMPESDPDLIPPPSYYQPIRGFGRLWREGKDFMQKSIRERLGWALAPEVSMENGLYQCDQHSYTTCYITGPDDHVYVLQPGHYEAEWYIWTGATPTPHY